MRHRLALAIPIALVFSIDDARAQTTLRSICAGRVGDSARTVGDTNGDGVGDIAAVPQGGSFARVYSGSDGTELFSVAIDYSYASAVWPAGDVDGDGRADLLVRSLDSSGTNGWTRLYAGRDWSVLRAWGPQQAGAALGDVDGDGFDDLALSDSGIMTVWSGRDGSALFTLPETVVRMGPVGDVDADGTPDFAASLTRGGSTGIVTIHSGLDGRRLHWLNGWQAGEGFGAGIAGCGDWNRDGHDDFAIGAPARTTNADGDGAIDVFSGADATLLHTFVGSHRLARLGSTFRPAGDVDANGFPDLISTPGYSTSFEIFGGPGGTRRTLSASSHYASGGDGAGDLDLDGYDDVVVAYDSCMYLLDVSPLSTRQPGRDWIFGTACPGLAGHLPRIEHAGRPDLDATLHVSLHGARPSTGCVLHIGLPSAIALDLVGMPGCSLYAAPLVAAGTGTDARGGARFTLAIPPDLAPLDFALNYQWAVWDPGANALGVTLSDGLGTVLGQPAP